MKDIKAIIIPESILAPLYDAAWTELTEKTDLSGATLNKELYARSYLNYLVLTNLHEKLPLEWQSVSLIVYNRYYWFLKYAKIHSEEHGRDAGLEQQSFNILEDAMDDLDWSVIEAIETQIHQNSA